MRMDFLTLFPDMCRAVMGESILGRAQKKGAVENIAVMEKITKALQIQIGAVERYNDSR